VETKVPVSTPIRPRLEELSGKLDEGRVSINDLKQIRTDVGNAITQGEAVPGVKEGRLKQLYAQLSKSIETGLDEIGDADLKQAWQEANENYARHAETFGNRQLAPLFKEADQPGLGNAAFVEQTIRQPDRYLALKSLLGDASGELQAFQKTARMRILEQSMADGSSTALDGQKLIRSLEGLRADNPDLFKDAFGSNGAQFIKAGRVLQTFQHNLPAEETEALLNPASRATPNALSNLQGAERRLKDEYANGALKDFVKGERGDLEPDKFIRFLPSYKLSDVQDVMRRLAANPDVEDEVRRKAMVGILQEARRSPSPADVLYNLKTGGQGGEIISGSGISKALGSGDQLAKYKEILGPGLFGALNNIAKRELLREEVLRVGGGAGMLAKGDVASSVLNMLTPGEGRQSVLRELPTIIRDKVAARILASPKLSSLLLTPHTLEQSPKLMAAIISSEPFIRATLEETKNPGQAYRQLSVLKSAFGTAAGGAEPGQHSMSDEEFLKEAAPPAPQP
jgi:hypothetical protein